MIRPSWFVRVVTKQFSILPWISYGNQSTQFEIYFDDYSLNVSLVIQKKRTVIHNLFSFSDDNLSYKSRNLLAVHVIARLDVSINEFFGSFLTFLLRFYLDLKRNIGFYPFPIKTNVVFFHERFSLTSLQNLSSLGSQVEDRTLSAWIFQWSTKQNFQTLQQILSQR